MQGECRKGARVGSLPTSAQQCVLSIRGRTALDLSQAGNTSLSNLAFLVSSAPSAGPVPVPVILASGPTTNLWLRNVSVRSVDAGPMEALHMAESARVACTGVPLCMHLSALLDVCKAAGAAHCSLRRILAALLAILPFCAALLRMGALCLKNPHQGRPGAPAPEVALRSAGCEIASRPHGFGVKIRINNNVDKVSHGGGAATRATSLVLTDSTLQSSPQSGGDAERDPESLVLMHAAHGRLLLQSTRFPPALGARGVTAPASAAVFSDERRLVKNFAKWDETVFRAARPLPPLAAWAAQGFLTFDDPWLATVQQVCADRKSVV